MMNLEPHFWHTLAQIEEIAEKGEGLAQARATAILEAWPSRATDVIMRLEDSATIVTFRGTTSPAEYEIPF